MIPQHSAHVFVPWALTGGALDGAGAYPEENVEPCDSGVGLVLSGAYDA
jgi:hypothetical protein